MEAYSSDFASLAGNNAGSMAAFGAGYIIGMLVVLAIAIVASWKIFTKAGEAGWKSLIPIYNLVTLFKIIGLSPWLLLLYLASIIPIVGSFVALGLSIVTMIKLGKAFGQSTGFIVGLILIPFVFELILAFGPAEYVGPDKN